MGDNPTGTAQAGNPGRYTIVYRARGSPGKMGNSPGKEKERQGMPDLERTRSRFAINYKISPDSPFLKSPAKSTPCAQESSWDGQKPAKQSLASIICGTEMVLESGQVTGFEIPALGSKTGTRGKPGFGLWQNAAMIALACAQLIQGVVIFAKGYKQENASYEQCVAPATVNLMGLNFAPAPEQDETKKLIQQNLVAMGKGFENLKAGLKANDTEKVKAALEQIKTSINFLDSRFSTLDYKDNIRIIARRVRECFIDETASTLQHALKYNADQSHKEKIDLNEGYYNYVKFTIRGNDYTVENMLDASLEITRDSLAKLLKAGQNSPANTLKGKDKAEEKKGDTSKIFNVTPLPVMELKIPGIVVPPLKTLDEMQGMKLTQKQPDRKIEAPVLQNQGISSKDTSEITVKQETAQKQTVIEQGLSQKGTSQEMDYLFHHFQQLQYRRDFKVTTQDKEVTQNQVRKSAIMSLLGDYGYSDSLSSGIADYVINNSSVQQKAFDKKFGAGVYGEIQKILTSVASNINKNGLTVYGYASMEVMQGSAIYNQQKKSNIKLSSDRAALGYDGVQLLFSQFSIKLNSKKIETEGRYLDTDANAMCQYLEGKQYAHPVSSDKFAITGKDEKEVAQNHLAYLMDNGIVQKNSAGKYSVSDVAAFQAYLFNAANGKIKELNGTDNPYMVLHRGVSLGFSPKIQLEISTISAQVNGKPGGQVEVPGSVEIIMPDKSALDRTGPQWQEKMPVTAGVYQGKDKVADAIFDRGSGKFIIRGLKTGDYNLVAFAQMNGLKTAQVTVPIKISGLVSPAHISIADPATKTVTFKADIGSDINAQIKANGNVYYSFGTFEKEGGQWVADIYDKDANLLGKAQVLDSQGKTVTGNILENSGIYYKGVKIGSSILKGADMEPSFALDEETGKTLAFMEENGLVKKVPVQNGTSSITVEQGNNLFPRNPSVSSAFMPETAKSP